MSVPNDPISPSQLAKTRKMLYELHFPVHRKGYQHLCVAVPLFAADPFQSLTKELYPAVAKHLRCADGWAVEHCIRYCIVYAWEHRNPQVWEGYFPDSAKAPSNKLFLSTLADRLE